MKYISYIFFLCLFLIIFLGWIPQEGLLLMKDFILNGFNLIAILTLIIVATEFVLKIKFAYDEIISITNVNLYNGAYNDLSSYVQPDSSHNIAFWVLKHHKGYLTGNFYNCMATTKLYEIKKINMPPNHPNAR